MATDNFIGEGWESVVIKNNNNTVSKFGFNKSLTEEFIKICQFQRRTKTNLKSYTDFSHVRLLELKDKSRIPKNSVIFSKMIESIENYLINDDNKLYAHENIKNFHNIETFDPTIYELIIPYIPGKNLDEIRRNSDWLVKYNFYRINNTIYKEIHIIPEIIKLKLINLLFLLLDDITIMNSEGIFHNDLHPGNILINGNSIKIVDFGYMTFNSPLTEIFNKPIVSDQSKILEVIELCSIE